jgi:hypothetical protein
MCLSLVPRLSLLHRRETRDRHGRSLNMGAAITGKLLDRAPKFVRGAVLLWQARYYATVALVYRCRCRNEQNK